ncbi:ATP-binding region ATPase domain-containing protein [Flammeovirgaceae bacterium 311]|nr:ATP-binding region ATPase domain-containing protein [Flammeovirgaceae bacterium 311]
MQVPGRLIFFTCYFFYEYCYIFLLILYDENASMAGKDVLEGATLLHNGKHTQLYVADLPAYGGTVVVKLVKDEEDSDTIRQLENEFQCLRLISSKKVRSVLGKLTVDYRSGLVLQYVEGLNLKEYLLQHHPVLSEKVIIAISLCQLLDVLHRRGLLHGNFCSENIIVHPTILSTTLLDFKLASPIPKEVHGTDLPTSLALAYMAPELSGNVTDNADERADLYSLGIVFYELFGEMLPFRNLQSPQALIHAQIAVAPPFLLQVNPEVPATIAHIVHKLLTKAPESRYQSAAGVQADLEQCTALLGQKGEIPIFSLARFDTAPRLQFPVPLFGRENEINQLRQVWQRINRGAAEQVWIYGHAGIGKTSLSEQVHAWARQDNASIARGKFNLLSANKPYDGIVQALGGLIELWLTRKEEELIYWREKVREAVGKEVKILTGLIPHLSLLMGSQSPGPQLEGPEAQYRFHFVLRNFIKALADEQHPLVFQLDDLQWADSATLNLLQEILSDEDFTYFLFLGIYRHGEIGEDHPLIPLLQDRKSGLGRLELELSNLKLEEVNEFLAETFKQSLAATGQLADVLFAKTNGNPLFLTQFLRTAFQSGLLSKEAKKGAVSADMWCWDIKGIQQLPQTENVLSFMISCFNQLDKETQALLLIAACIGKRFSKSLILELVGDGVEYPQAVLKRAISEGYIIAEPSTEGLGKDTIYRFLHDRLLQAVYSTLEEGHKLHLHQQIGSLLLAKLQEDGDVLFDVVTHFSLAGALLNPDEQLKLVNLNLQAGRKAMNATGYVVALKYFQDGIGLLPQQSWQLHYRLILNLYTEAANAAYLTGAFNELEDYLQAIEENALDVVDKARAIDTKIQALIARNDGSAAVETALTILAELGVKLSRNPSKAAILASLLKTEWMLKRKGMHKLAGLPAMQDPRALAITQIMGSVGAAVSRCAPMLFPIFVCKLVQLSIKNGNTLASIPAYSGYGVLQTALFNKVQKGYAYGTLAVALLDLLQAEAAAAKTYVVVAAFLDFWVNPLRNSIEIAQKGYEAGLKNGDLEFAASGLMIQCTHGYLAGESLPQLAAKMAVYSQQILQLKQELLYQQTQLFHQAVLNLMQEDEISISLQGNVFDERSVVTPTFEESSKAGVYYLNLQKLILAYLAGQYHIAQECSSLLADKSEHVMGSAVLPAYLFYDALLQAARYSSLLPAEQRKAFSRLEKAIGSMNKWARHAPMNFGHKYNLLRAEMYRIKGDFLKARITYENAAQGAHEQGYLQEKALAFELAGQCLLEQRKQEAAHDFLLKAYKAYLQWGAKAKASQLLRQYPVLQPLIAGNTSGPSTFSNKGINVEGLLKAATALSSEMRLDKMLENLLSIVLQQAGAQEGYILINRDDVLEVMAKGRAGQGEVELLAGLPIEEYNELPSSIINFTYRVKEELVLSDAQTDKRFASDAVVAIRYIRSVLCFPVIRQQRVLGIIYLHNTLTTGAFTVTQLQLLRLLSGQIAVALENALLYTQMERRVEERTSQLKVQQQILEDKNKELQLLNQEKDELVNIVAHDLRSPLNQIRGMLNLIKLASEKLTADQQQFLDLSLKSSDRLSDMIARILDTNAMDSQEIALHLEVVDMEILLEEVVTNFRIQAANKNIALQVVLPEQPIEIEIDRNYTIQILENLISNALKFSPPGSQVQVILYEDGDIARIEIKDQGPGISKRDQKRLFSKFQTLTARPTGGEDSTGLGLSIAKRYVEAMGGQIGCDSEVGEGSVFFVEFVLV